MKKAFVFFICYLLGFPIFSQLIENGQPFSWTLNLEHPTAAFINRTLNNSSLKEKYSIEKLDKSFRFGEETDLTIDIIKEASITRLHDGGHLYRYLIKSKNAVSLNFIFSQFSLKKGSLMYLYSGDKKSFTGAYSFLNQNEEGILGTDILKTSEVIIEVYEPANNLGSSSVELGQIIHGFQDVDSFTEKAFGGAGGCNYDVNCPLGSDFQDQKNGVALTISGGLACSGSLVNNTSGEIIPYYLSARHCGTSTSNWVLRFNWERTAAHAICAQTNSTDNNGITTNIITGTSLKASSNISDFTLVKLNSTPAASWNVFYNGWDNSEAETVTSSTVIHHPSSDIKKISKSSVHPYKSGIPFNGSDNCQVWRVDYWEQGITEQGSSGSPLFDQNKRIIGVLTGGSSSCSGLNPNSGYDLFGRFGYSWNTLSDSNQQLKHWLDPTNTGVTYIDGVYSSATDFTDLALPSLAWLTEEICEVVQPYIVLYNMGNQIITSAKISYSFNGSETIKNWVGTLSAYQTDTIYFDFPALTNGNITFSAEITEINGGTDDYLANNYITHIFRYDTNSQPVTFEFLYNFYTNETSWELVNKDTPSVIIEERTYTANGVPPLTLEKCLPEGCYQLILKDSYGDGWSDVEYGNGSLVIHDKEGNVLGELKPENANFGSLHTIEFCIKPLSTLTINKFSVQLYPNPSKDKITITTDSGMTIEQVTITDLNGKVIRQINDNNSKELVISHQLANGIYIVNVKTDGGDKMMKLVVN